MTEDLIESAPVPWMFGAFTDDGSTDPRPSVCVVCGSNFEEGERLSMIVVSVDDDYRIQGFEKPARQMIVQLAHSECPV